MNSWLSLFDPTNQDKEAASDDLPSHIEIKDDNGVGHLVNKNQKLPTLGDVVVKNRVMKSYRIKTPW